VAELQELIATMDSAGDAQTVAAARILLASYLDRLGQRDQAQSELAAARVLARELNDPYLLATELWERGWELVAQDELHGAEAALEEAAAQFARSGNRLHEARVKLGLGFVRGVRRDWAGQAELSRTALATFHEFGAERPRFLSHVRLLAAERELGNLRAAAYHAHVAWQMLSRLGRAERYVRSDMARETALLFAVGGESRAAATVFGWQRALIETTGVLEDEWEQQVAARTLGLIRAAFGTGGADADAAISVGAASGDDVVADIAIAALERLEQAKPRSPG
jgi:tetratricopeptide (TPR) repeat protein